MIIHKPLIKRFIVVEQLLLISKLVLNVEAACTPAIVWTELQISGYCTTGYYLKDSSSAAVTTVSSCTSTAKCTLMSCSALDTDCTAASSITGYVITALDKSLLSCENGDCYQITSATGFYISPDKSLITCTSDVCDPVPSANGLYINAGGADSTSALLSCSEGSCDEITSPGGLYINGDIAASGTPIIECTSGSSCNAIAYANDCSSIGSIIANNKFCFSDAAADAQVITGTTEKYYLVTLPSGTPFGDDGNVVIVKTGNGIVEKVSDPTGYYAVSSDEIIVSCDAAHACTEVTPKKGYFVNAGYDKDTKPVIECNGTTCSTTSTTKTKCSEVSKVGDLVISNEVQTNFCSSKTDGTQISFNTAGYYLLTIASGSTTIFTGSTSAETTVLVKSGNGMVVSVDSPSGYYINFGGAASTPSLISCDANNKCSIITSTGGYYANAGTDDASNIIIQCTPGSVCTATPASTETSCANVNVGGLVKNDNDPKYFCSEKAANKQISINSDATLKYYKLIIAANTANPFTGTTDTSASNDILVKVGNGAVELITNASNSESEANFYAVKETNVVSDEETYTTCSPNNSIIKYNYAASSGKITSVKQCIQTCNLDSTDATGCKEGYYIADAQKHYVKDTTTAGTLYQCIKENNKFKCSVVTKPPLGYLINAGNQADSEDVPYIKCEIDSDNTACKPYSPAALADCSSSSIGAIISKEDTVDSHVITTYSICLELSADGTIAIGKRAAVEDEPNLTMTAETTTAGSYMISDKMYNSSLTDSKFLIIDLANGNATINQEENPIRYKYTNAKAKIYDSFTCTVNAGVYTITDPNTTPAEYKLDDADLTDTIYFYTKI